MGGLLEGEAYSKRKTSFEERVYWKGALLETGAYWKGDLFGSGGY